MREFQHGEATVRVYPDSAALATAAAADAAAEMVAVLRSSPEANVIFGVVLDPNIGNEVRLTLIATGFTTKEALAGTTQEKEISQLLRSLETNDELDIPSFLRRDALIKQRSRPDSPVKFQNEPIFH